MMRSMGAQAISIVIVLILGSVVGWGCGPTRMRMEQAAGMVELPRQSGDTKLPVDSPFQVPSARRGPSTIASTLAFQLPVVPNPAKLELLVTGIDSACPLEGEPQGSTTLLVNGHEVTSFSLGPSGIGRTYRVTADLEPTALKAGSNTLVLKGAPCTLGIFEVVRINDVVVRPSR